MSCQSHEGASSAKASFSLASPEQFHLVIAALAPGRFSVHKGVCFRGRDKHHTGTISSFARTARQKKAIFTVI